MAYDIKHGTNKTLFLSFLLYFDRLLTYNMYFIRTYLTQQYGVWPLYLINTLITVINMFKLTCKKCIIFHHLYVLKMKAYIVVVIYKKMLPLYIQ